jgi:hypothetical protein
MAVIHDKLSAEKIEEIEEFLLQRFTYLQSLRADLNTEVTNEIGVYNNKDAIIDAREQWEERVKVPFAYTAVQTIKARMVESFFGEDNYVKIFCESEIFNKIGTTTKLPIDQIASLWIQEEIDKLKLGEMANDILEEALVKRVCWLQLQPVVNGNTMVRIDLGIYGFFDVWFDTACRNTEESDFFIRKTKRLYEFYNDQKRYREAVIEDVLKTVPPEDLIRPAEEKQEYQDKHNASYYTSATATPETDRLELLEYLGVFNISEDPKKPEYRDVIFTWANRTTLVRAETVDLKTDKKKLLFPIRPLKQSLSLLGKSVPGLIADMCHELNVVKSMRLQNAKLQNSLLFKYKRTGGVDFSELFAGPGNSIGYDDDPNEITPFEVPNLTQSLSYIAQDIVNDAQQTTGAVDFITGAKTGPSLTDTATGIRDITRQAMFKFSAMGRNTYPDFIDVIKYVIILNVKYGKEGMLMRYPDLSEFTDMTEKMIEDSNLFDISLADVAEQREVVRSQLINGVNIFGPMVAQMGGNAKELIRQTLEVMGYRNINSILPLDPERFGMGAQNVAAAAVAPPAGVATESSSAGAATPVSATAPKQDMPTESAATPMPAAV